MLKRVQNKAGLALVAAAIPILCASTSSIADDAPYAIRAGAYIDKNGKAVAPAILVVESGKIRSIGPDASVPDGVRVLDRPEATICPGFIDIHVTLGTRGRTGEQAHSIETTAQAVELFDRFHHDFERAVRSGITSVVLAPSSRHLVGGATAVVRTAGSDPQARVLGPGPLKISMAAAAFNLSRTPTSIQGGLQTLRRMIDDAGNDRTDNSPFARWARGETAALVDTGGAAELNILAGFVAERKVKCIALNATYAAERMSDVKMLAQPVVVGPYDFSSRVRFARTPGMLAEAGVDFAFASAAPVRPPELLRISAAVAMAHGLSSEKALAALTTTPAAIAGYADRIGSLEPGKDADFVLYSGHPLDLSSRILEVFVHGERVHRAPRAAANRSRRAP